MIEVVAGLVILGTLLASVAIARGRFLRQWGEADRRLRATRAVDDLLSTWMNAAPSGPGSGLAGRAPTEGELAGLPNHVWRTRPLPSASAARLGARVVRLEVFDRSTGSSGAPLLAVDFLEHDPTRHAPAPQPDAAAAPREAR